MIGDTVLAHTSTVLMNFAKEIVIGEAFIFSYMFIFLLFGVYAISINTLNLDKF